MGMTAEQVATVFGGEVKVNEDSGVDFTKPVKGKYLAKITVFERKKTEKMDAVIIKMQAFKDLEGDASSNRFFDKAYWLTDGQYSTAQYNIFKLGNDLFTMGVFDEQEVPEEPMTIDNIDELLKLKLVDRQVKLSCWIYNEKQSTRIVVNDNEEKWDV